MDSKEIIKAAKERHLYDFVASNYWKLDNHTLARICLEAIAAVSDEEILETYIEEAFEDYEEC